MKSTPKQKLSSGLSLLISLVAFVSCGGVKADTSKVSVVWWNNYQVPDLAEISETDARNNSAYREYYYAKDLISAFEKEHPYITVEQVYKGNYAKI